MNIIKKIIKISQFGLAISLLVGSLGVLFAPNANAVQVDTDWLDQFGPAGSDVISAIDASDNVYVTGTVAPNQALPGQTSSGSGDVFLRKYSSSGSELWTRQFGTTNSERARGVVVDASGVYVIGSTAGTFSGQTMVGLTDAFISKFDTSGNELWTKQFGSTDHDSVWGAGIDSGGVYIVGSTHGAFDGFTNLGGSDAFVSKYSSDGNQLWLDQFGTDSSYDDCYAVYADATGVYVGGTTGYGTTEALGSQNLGEGDAYLRKYDSSGTLQWTQQFGTADYEQAFAISGHGGYIYVAGETYSALSGETYLGNGDAFVGKFDASGSQLWIDQYGTTDYETTYSIFANSTGIYISGLTYGTLPGETNLGGSDAYMIKYNDSGDKIWTHQFGTDQDDVGHRLSADSSAIFISGRTTGAFPGKTNSGGTDVFVAKIYQEDYDDDGIFTVVDGQPATYSDAYSDGTTSGTIVTRGDQVLSIDDAIDVNDGVLVSASATGGATAAELSSCGGTVTTYLDAGDQVTITCGSAILGVESGAIEAIFYAENGTVGTVSLETDNKVTFKPETATFIADEDNISAVNVEVNGNVVEVTPGETQPIFITIEIDIKPGNDDNVINSESQGVIPVAILTNEDFDAASVDPLSISLNGSNVRQKGASGNIGVMKDVDNDGDIDLLVNLENWLQLTSDTATATLTAFTYDGVTVEGSNTLTIVN